MIQWLPTVNASLNALSLVLLVVGYVLIKRKQETAHRNVMLAAFGVSGLFLACYLTYHGLRSQYHGSAHVEFAGEGAIRYFYYPMLISHIILAAAVPILAIITIYHGLKNNRKKHLCFARWTFPIWVYVSVTGVLVYLMLYHLYPHPTG
ncbi:MAG: DUF420 domain-containing protein [Planctomycetales bacterium]